MKVSVRHTSFVQVLDAECNLSSHPASHASGVCLVIPELIDIG